MILSLGYGAKRKSVRGLSLNIEKYLRFLQTGVNQECRHRDIEMIILKIMSAKNVKMSSVNFVAVL